MNAEPFPWKTSVRLGIVEWYRIEILGDYGHVKGEDPCSGV